MQEGADPGALTPSKIVLAQLGKKDLEREREGADRAIVPPLASPVPGHKQTRPCILRPVTRYGFAIKALPKGGKPFGDDEDEESEETPEQAAPGTPPSTPEPAADVPDPAETPPQTEAAPAEEAEPPADDHTEPPPPPADDARPWSGDMYDEGDETVSATAFAAYTGTAGEEAWLDQAPDGTLTGWVRDSTGQVWRYSDADAWAIDVDDAQMTRTHSNAETSDAGTATADEAGEQESLFPPQ